MKKIYLLATFGGLMLSNLGFAQDEGNSAFRDLLEKKQTQELLRNLKDNPEGSLKAAQDNPDALLRNAMGIFAEKTSKTSSGATRGGKSQSEKALSNINKLIAQPTGSQQALPVPTGIPDKFKVDSSKINQLKSAATEAIPALSSIIPKDDPPAQPRVVNMPSIPEPRALPRRSSAPAPAPIPRAATPLKVTSSMAPPAPLRDMQPTSMQIPDSPELFASGVPAPKALGPRYPKPSKFQPQKAANNRADSAPKPDSDTMVITASSSEMDSKKHIVTFYGDVMVEMDGLELTCDRLVVYLNKENAMERIVATGGTVEIKKIGENGQLQVAKAKKAEYIEATKTAMLSGGPPYMQNGDQYIATDSEDSIIELQGNGKVKVSSPKTNVSGGRTVIVLPIGNIKGRASGLNIDNKFKGLTN